MLRATWRSCHFETRALGSIALLAGCATAAITPMSPTRPSTPTPVSRSARPGPAATIASVARAPLPPANPKLPPVPDIDGPLRINVVYPPEHALIQSRDSNFIFGSIGNGAAGLSINGTLVPVWPNGAFMGWVPNPPTWSQWYDLVAYTPTDTTRLRYFVRTPVAQPPRRPERPDIARFATPLAAVLRDDSLDRFASDTDNLIIGRPTPDGTYKWFLFPNTPVRVLEYRNDMAHVQLDARQDIWVARRDIRTAAATAPERLTISDPHVASSAESFGLELRVARPPAYLVQEGARDITLTLYNTAPASALAMQTDSQTDSQTDPLIAGASQRAEGIRTIYHFDLNRPLYGYLALYENGIFTLKIRRPPRVNPTAPLRGMTVVVDPGHPPIGATGPTGLWEPVATLAVGLRVRDLLEQQGARVVMTRTDPAPVALGARPVIARRADANAFVSIHLNADADGQNPFRDNGTGTYYFHPQSKPLATFIQQSLVPQLGLRDRGVFFQNLAVCRPTWFPAVLAEGLFIIMPDQEAAIRTAEYQEAYARGIVNGLQQYFASLAQ